MDQLCLTSNMSAYIMSSVLYIVFKWDVHSHTRTHTYTLSLQPFSDVLSRPGLCEKKLKAKTSVHTSDSELSIAMFALLYNPQRYGRTMNPFSSSSHSSDVIMSTALCASSHHCVCVCEVSLFQLPALSVHGLSNTEIKQQPLLRLNNKYWSQCWYVSHCSSCSSHWTLFPRNLNWIKKPIL